MKYRKLSAPLSIQIEVTEDCNNNCVHCYNHWRESSQIQRIALSETQFSQIANLVISSKIFTVTVTGGEPLLFWRNIMNGIATMTNAGVDVSVNSNLTLFTDKIAQELKNAGVKSILTSVLCSREEIHDCVTKKPGSLKKTVLGMKKAVNCGFHVSVNMVLMKNNYPFIYETAVFLKNLGVSYFCATKASPALNSRKFDKLLITREQLKRSLEELERVQIETGLNVDILECYPLCLISDVARFKYFARRNCTAGVTTCTISPLGDVRPCSHADMIYGNIFSEDFSIIWGKMNDWREAQYIPDECLACKFVKRCSGGCRMEAKYRGNIKGKDPYMSCEKDVIFKTTNEEKKKVINENQELTFISGLKMREEKFGGLLFAPKSGPVFVNRDAYTMVLKLVKTPMFSMHSVSKRFDSDISSIRTFLTFLMARGVVLKSDYAKLKTVAETNNLKKEDPHETRDTLHIGFR